MVRAHEPVSDVAKPAVDLGDAMKEVGGFIGRAMGFYGPTESAGWIISILGAIVLLVLYRMMVRRRV